MTTIQEYYELMENQEKKINSLRRKIYDKTTSTLERRELFKKNKIKCSNCKKTGGIIFDSSGEFLLASCGAEDKCGLSIKIPRTHSKYIPHIDLINIINNIKEKIITIKTKHLFGLLSENNTLEEIE